MRRIDIYEESEARDTAGEQPVFLIGITVGRRRALNVSLSGRPNGFLIPYLIEHAAEGAALPVRRIDRRGSAVVSWT